MYFLGRLSLNIPWKSIYVDPVEIEIEDILVIAGPQIGVCLDITDPTQKIVKQRSWKSVFLLNIIQFQSCFYNKIRLLWT